MTASPTPKEPQRLRRVVIKEELVRLTGYWRLALILNQLLYWAERHADFDRFIAEEQSRDPTVKIHPTYGWIYKSSKELIAELMLDVSEPTIRRDVARLIERGWLLQRNNPHQAWDRELQYRPDIRAIQRDLQLLGFALDGYPLLDDTADAPSPLVNNASFMVKDAANALTDTSSLANDGATADEPGTVTPPSSMVNNASFMVKDAANTLPDASSLADDGATADPAGTVTPPSYMVKDASYMVKDRSDHHVRCIFHGERAIPETTTETPAETTTETTTPQPPDVQSVVAVLRTLGLTTHQAMQATERHQLTCAEAEQWRDWVQRLDPMKTKPVAILAAAIKQQRLPPHHRPSPAQPEYDPLAPAGDPPDAVVVPLSRSDGTVEQVSLSNLWQQVQIRLQGALACHDFETWIKPTSLMELTDREAVVGTPNVFVRQELEQHYRDLLTTTLQTALGRSVSLLVAIQPTPTLRQ